VVNLINVICTLKYNVSISYHHEIERKEYISGVKKIMGKIIAVCKSKQKGTSKKPVKQGHLREDYGLAGDAHANDTTHRQISLLAVESINKMADMGIDIGPGDFAENLTTQGIMLVSLPVGTHLSIGKEILLELTQIGKTCHRRCAIYRQLGQ